MEVEYKTTVGDYVAFSLHMHRKCKVMRTQFLVGWLFLPLLSLVGAVTLFAVIGSALLALICAVAGAVYAIFYPSLHRWSNARTIREYAEEKKVRGVIGPIRLILTEESLVEITEVTRSEAKWREMSGIEEVGDYTYIFVTGMHAAILPRHGFDRDDEYFSVRDFARARIRAIP